MSNEPVVETKLGKLRGAAQRSILGDDYFAFKGIPYAKPPVGELRFQDPIPIELWDGIRDCSKHGSICAQSDFFFTKSVIIGSDDCLYLNVYVKNLKPNKKLPVMVWIHGGAFILGSGDEDWSGPDYYMQKDIVLVTINYRLGVLGFLNLEDEIAPGNQGLKDQVMALRWVRDHIANFGGDSENVTIFGISAGGASVHYLCISPLAVGLFDKAISQSGVALNPWTQVPDPKKFAYKMSKLLGNDTHDHKKIVEFLKKIDASKLIEIQDKLLTQEEKLQFVFPFGPGVDAKSKNPFMPTEPVIAAEKGVHVPLIIGYTSREGIMFVNTSQDPWKDAFPTQKSDFKKFVHPNLKKTISKYNLKLDDVRRLYFNNDDVTMDGLENLVDFFGETHFVEGIHKVVKIQVEKSSSPTYLYQFSFDKIPSPFKLMTKTNIAGASHGDDMMFLFRVTFMESMSRPLEKGTDSYKIMEQMVELWVNFATTGRPTPTLTELVPFYWQPVADGTVLHHLNISEDLRMDVTLNYEERLKAHNFRQSDN